MCRFFKEPFNLGGLCRCAQSGWCLVGVKYWLSNYVYYLVNEPLYISLVYWPKRNCVNKATVWIRHVLFYLLVSERESMLSVYVLLLSGLCRCAYNGMCLVTLLKKKLCKGLESQSPRSINYMSKRRCTPKQHRRT